MPDAFILDAVRTPRGRGKPDGGLHQVAPIELAATTLRALRQRNGFAPDAIEDVILGCVNPIKDQSGAEKVAAGKSLSFGDILGLNWLVEGVEGKLT